MTILLGLPQSSEGSNAYQRTIRINSEYSARLYGQPDPGEEEIAIRILPKHGKTWSPIVFKVGFGYPDKLTVFRLKSSNVYCIVSYSDGGVNGFSNIWLFDGRRHRLVQAARGLTNVLSNRFPTGRIHQETGPQFAEGYDRYGQYMVQRYGQIDAKQLTVHFGKWTVVPGTRY